MRITNHAQERSKERNGWSDKVTERMIPKILEKGIRHNQTKGNLHKWMTSLYNNHRRKGTDIRLYGDKAYVFVNEALVTVLQIPSSLTKDMHKMVKKDENG